MENEVLNSHRIIAYQNQEVKQSLYDGYVSIDSFCKNEDLLRWIYNDGQEFICWLSCMSGLSFGQLYRYDCRLNLYFVHLFLLLRFSDSISEDLSKWVEENIVPIPVLPEDREESKNRFLRSLEDVDVGRTPLPVAEIVSDTGRRRC
ncbi:MAG: hypothetical protein F6J93_03605 [Oscillatoria sp. SIO1A7]|nr:hypothetical protein [Oscillatoria sp. SIO1A7]